MDELQEHQRRQDDDEFWDEKQRGATRSRHLRPRDLSIPNNDASPDMTSRPANEDLRHDPIDRSAEDASTFPAQSVARPAQKKRSMAMLWLLCLLVLGALGYQGYRMWQKRNAAAMQAGAESSGAAPALPPVLAAAPLPATVGVPIQVVAQVEPAGPTPDQVELNARLDRMEARMTDVIEGLRAQGYIIGDAGANGVALPTTAFAPRVVVPTAPTMATPIRRSPVRKPNPPVRVVKSLPAVTRQQLLSVDMWDGRPSVVVGNGDVKNPQVKVLQQGDTFNGITLNNVDVAGQRATFTDGTRSIYLDVSN
jgi:hypothetical protein